MQLYCTIYSTISLKSKLIIQHISLTLWMDCNLGLGPQSSVRALAKVPGLTLTFCKNMLCSNCRSSITNKKYRTVSWLTNNWCCLFDCLVLCYLDYVAGNLVCCELQVALTHVASDQSKGKTFLVEISRGSFFRYLVSLYPCKSNHGAERATSSNSLWAIQHPDRFLLQRPRKVLLPCWLNRVLLPVDILYSMRFV
jgi:hypothetical protein